ncbi:hypothetical protein WJX82_000826 [Trebouxia sp. C0006]
MANLSVCSTAAIVSFNSSPRRPSAHLACQRSALNGVRISQKRTPRRIKASAAHSVVTTMGLPIPIIGPLFNPFFAALAYALGAARFWSNYSRTSFDSTQKTKLTALWPFLFIGSKSFRDDFKKTLNS